MGNDNGNDKFISTKTKTKLRLKKSKKENR